MSIVALNKVTVFGLGVEKMLVLEGLQQLGCLHLISLQPPLPQAAEFTASDRQADAQTAWHHIMDVPRRRHQVSDEAGFDFDRVVAAALANRQQRREAEDKKLILAERLQQLAPWGNFTLPNVDDLGGYRLWFYSVPHPKAKQIQTLELPWQIMGQDHLHVYVVAIAKTEPPADALPVPRTHTGVLPLAEVKQQLQQVDIELDEIEAEQEALSRWIFLLAKHLARAEDQGTREAASRQTREEDGILMVQGWIPTRSLKRLAAFAEQHQLAWLSEPPQPEETPPTLMDNPPIFQAGQDLVTFYAIPGYRDWDPSPVVFFSFALFFAMILADAGYALVLAVIVACFWSQMGKSAGGRHFRILAVLVLPLAIIYGMLLGSYFGVVPPQGSLLSQFKVFNPQDHRFISVMMRFSIAIGCLHIAFANAVVAYRAGGFASKAKPLGWIAVIFGSLALYLGWQNLGIGLLVGGLLAIFLGGFVGSQKQFPWRVIDGLGSLIKFSQLFGDVMSYLRLFALGLASASLALTFNQLAGQVYQAVPGLGILLSILILLLGHGINLLLAIVSGFVHGLRLNYIEFFNWSLAGEGYPFQAFAKKESDL
jgi:V/A-type H+/Na+-transporting ATPase subunit I